MDERDRFLVDFHARYPGITARVVAGGRLDGGGSSYDGMVERLAGSDGPVLDLGCGDGYLLERIRDRYPDRALAGVDMSAAELAAARSRPRLAGVDLVQARADALPFEDGRFGAVVSHMAFMLMTPVDAVVAELGRVLATGGRFVAAVGGGPVADDAFDRFLSILQRHRGEIDRLPPRIGDKRARSPEGLRELLNPATGFEPPRIVDDTVRFDGTVDALWPFLSGIYELGFADSGLLDRLRDELTEAVADLAGDGGVVPCSMRQTFVTTRRAA